MGSYLKHLRTEKGYTLNEVAEKLNLSASFLSQLENMKLSPSLDSLEKLLRLYAVNLSDFFKQIEQRRFIIVKKGEERTLDISDGNIRITFLASKLQNNALESCIVKFSPDSEFETAVLPKEINGERLIYIMQGKSTVVIDRGEPVTLEAGDSINYKSHIPCTVRNSGPEDAELLISGIPPLLL